MISDINAIVNIYIDNEKTFLNAKKINKNKFKDNNWKNIENIQALRLLYDRKKINDNIKFNYIKIKAHSSVEKANKLVKKSLNNEFFMMIDFD